MPMLVTIAVSALSTVLIGAGEFGLTAAEDLADSRIVGPAAIDDRPQPTPADSDAAHVLAALTGSFRASGDVPLDYHAAPVAVDGLDNALYFEISRTDSPWAPFRQGVFHVYRRQGKLTLRVFDLAGHPTFKDAIAGLWAAPDTLSGFSIERLHPNLDLQVTVSANEQRDIAAATAFPFPTTRAGAVEMTSTLAVMGGGSLLVVNDKGFDATGKQVWGPTEKDGVRFRRLTPDSSDAAAVQRLDGGVTAIDIVPARDPAGPRLQSGGTLVCQFSFYLTDGTLIESSRKPGRSPFRASIPGTPIKGFDAGVLGLGPGQRRRIVIPPAMGYGEQGARNQIPANATLIFDVECLDIENPVPAPPQDPQSAPATAPSTPAAPGEKPADPPGNR